MKLFRVISGGQTGADQAGLFVAKKFGLETGGYMPLGFKTLEGPRIDFAHLFQMIQHTSENYAARTDMNVFSSDGTVRLAGNFSTAGEVCTLKSIKRHKKPYIDIDLSDLPDKNDLANWVIENNIGILNVAGNSEQTFLGSFKKASAYLTHTFFCLGLSMRVSKKEILDSLGISDHVDLHTEHGCVIERMHISKPVQRITSDENID